MKTIWKFDIPGPLFPSKQMLIYMPSGAMIRHIAGQKDRLCLWAEVDTDAKPEPRIFCVYGTGHQIQPEFDLVFLGTAILYQGDLVMHIYEIADEK